MPRSLFRLLPPVAATVLSTIAMAGLAPQAGATADTASTTVLTIDRGYLDAIDVDWTGTSLTLDIRDATVIPAVDRDPAGVNLVVRSAARTAVPSGPAWAFLGNPGDPVWVLPQTQRADLLWPAFNVGGVPAGVMQGDTVAVKLVAANGPGDVSLFSLSAFGTPSVWIDSGNGLPDTTTQHIKFFRTHPSWAFEAPGTYSLTFEVTAVTTDGRPVTSGPKTYTFTVQP